ncbi:hypothetical protein GCM10007979_22890 [Nocardioides albus]|nr:hypothetical protein GCM10007979_22890 [Nocardioides albus]
MDRLVLQIEIDPAARTVADRERHGMQVGVGRALSIGLDAAYGFVDPGAMGVREAGHGQSVTPP